MQEALFDPPLFGLSEFLVTVAPLLKKDTPVMCAKTRSLCVSLCVSMHLLLGCRHSRLWYNEGPFAGSSVDFVTIIFLLRHKFSVSSFPASAVPCDGEEASLATYALFMHTSDWPSTQCARALLINATDRITVS